MRTWRGGPSGESKVREPARADWRAKAGRQNGSVGTGSSLVRGSPPAPGAGVARRSAVRALAIVSPTTGH